MLMDGGLTGTTALGTLLAVAMYSYFLGWAFKDDGLEGLCILVPK